MQNLLHNLNPEQLAAVTLPAQSALILAGAGSGKTRVLTTRIAWLIQTGQVSPAGILAVTFTNKAAKEMLTRLSAMLPINTRGMWIGTFHGLCNRLLRTDCRDAALRDLMLAQPRFMAAAAFYLVYAAGTVFLAVAPGLRALSWQTAALHGAVLGFIAYATYDLTNYAILKAWPLGLALADIAWGALLTAMAAAAGYLAASRWG
eukprot:gene24250-27432_t